MMKKKQASFLNLSKKILDVDNTGKVGKLLGLKYIPIGKDEQTDNEAENEAAFKAILKDHGMDPDAQYYLFDADDGVGYSNRKLDRARYDMLMDKFYTAVILQYRLNHKGESLTGNYDNAANEEALKGSNRIPKDVEAYYYDPALKNAEMLPTDELLFGTQKYTVDGGSSEKEYPVSFYTYLSATNTEQPAGLDLEKGKDARLKYFGSADAFNHYTGMKLYYRADIANYVGNTSNRITERNMAYQTTGTIQTLGAKTMHDAIYSEENTMKVDVKVNNWKLSINQVPM